MRDASLFSREEYLRLEGFVPAREPDGREDEPLLRYLVVNFALLGTGLAAWAVAVASLMWVLF